MSTKALRRPLGAFLLEKFLKNIQKGIDKFINTVYYVYITRLLIKKELIGMLEMLKNWKGTVEINGQTFDNIQTAMSHFKVGNGEICIKLHPMTQTGQKTDSVNPQPISVSVDDGEIRITVKKYMTEKATPQFDFMEKWNNNNPMPYRTMTGKVIKETKGMVQMELHAGIWAEKIYTCMCCGRPLTNPVSQYFGIGPECGGHNYTHPFNSDKELRDAVAAYKTQLQSVKWTGWVIKSAITNKEETKND